MTEIPQIISRKLRVVLVNFFCFAFSIRELQSSLMSHDESPLSASYHNTFHFLLFILALLSGLNSWIIAGDLHKPMNTLKKTEVFTQTNEEQTRSESSDVSYFIDDH